MSIKVGCFALIDPFSSLDHQLERIAGLGFKYADVTDSHPGSSLGRDYGFAATVSLDDNPLDVKRLFERHGLTITSVCAHATLLDPVSPARFGTTEILKAIRLAAGMGVAHVITTEGHPQTEWAHKLSRKEQLLVIVDKLYEPVRLAADLGVVLLLEPHGPLTDSIDGLGDIIDALGNPPNVGINLDTGNSWLGGADPVAMAKAFKDRIYHIHWKDLPAEWEAKRGTMWGCGFGPVALGDGVIDIKGVFEVLKDAPHVEYSTLEVGGDANMLKSYAYLKSLGAE
ncbi:MAG: sugar phosphate isomerase/epimerase [Anaerolineae bacterium]|nr:sugar phosphate isomerase/epimerase [Caldilineales bacterium]MCX7853808.1 sugar phosphate isomerase/epimerase [Caldilineales bacterium]MDW8268060.1 sugar phosphate isomerase/epimerase [Anaerolineae bacterium]